MQDSPAGAEDAVQHAGDRRVEVGVGQDHGRRLAAELERDRHHLVGGDVRDVLPVVVPPVKDTRLA